jgi:glucokinase
MPDMSSTRTSYDLVVLSGDIGGTNANFALIGKKGGTFTLLFDRHYRTRAEPTLVSALEKFVLEAARECPGIAPELCCISAAGPVIGRRIELTNAPWSIDGAEVESHFGFRTLLINDFTAISYGVLLLDPRDPEELLRLPHTDGSLPDPKPGVRVVIGAGTGLGYGYVVKIHDRTEAFASEGGHVTLPVYDEVSRALQSWLAERMDFVPGAEAAVSGIGISNIHEFFYSRMGCREGLNAEILRMDGGARPALISANAEADPVCAATMDMFVRLYARVAADAAATFLPSGGVFLAGGIAAKNEARFLEGQRFMETFEKSYRGHIRSILCATPVMIVKDYAISLYGAANAAVMNC